MIKLELTPDQFNNLVASLDVVLKTSGLNALQGVVDVYNVLRKAKDAAEAAKVVEMNPNHSQR
jgi:hypothetical protein